MIFLLLAACTVDNAVEEKHDPVGFDTADSWSPPDDSDTAVEELCNGVDDDGDGDVDEGFPDDDANGRVDCLDVTCPPLDLPAAAPVPVSDTCDAGEPVPVPDPWAVRAKWNVTAPSADPTCIGAYSMPAVGNLDDDNGDGRVDDLDMPDVVLPLSCGDVLALDGETGAEKWMTEVGGWPHVLIADVDADKEPEVVVGNATLHAMALNGADGKEEWTSLELASALYYVVPVPADLDEDGKPEIVTDDLVLNGEDGTRVAKFNLAANYDTYRIPAVADVDLDGDEEIALGGHLYDSDGTELWASGLDGPYGYWSVILQADGDDEAEIGFLGAEWSVYDPDGTQLYSVDYGSVKPGPPCFGDLDGDGAGEVAFPDYALLYAYEMDGTLKWTAPISDASGLSGCSAFDLDNDGALEVLYADQSAFYIFDGATGAVRYVDETHNSSTSFEYPTVADLGNDGHAEILVTHNYGAVYSLTAYENDGDGWPAAGPTWPSHDFAMTNVYPDGTIPQHPDPAWLTYGVYRARLAMEDTVAPDLRVAITDQCIADCTYGPVAVGVLVGNEGTRDADAGAVLRLYADDDAGRRLVGSTTLPAVPSGMTLDTIEFELTAADIGRYGWVAVVDEDDGVRECDEGNNEDAWTDVSCP